VAAVCGEDEALRDEVESLLAHTSRAAEFLDPSALAAMSHAVVRSETGSMTGRRMGAYEIQNEQGAGGMGKVYRLETGRWAATSRSSFSRRS
jgi:hypothetical protein